MSNKCPKCSSTFTEKTKFCKICGCNLQEELIENPTCPKCKTVFSSEIKFCVQDGTKLVHPDKLIPKCVNCKKAFNNGVKFCPNDGGAIKLDSDILYLINDNSIKDQEPSRSIEDNTNSTHTTNTNYYNQQQPSYPFTIKYSKAPLGKRLMAYILDSLITMALLLPSLYFLLDFFRAILIDHYYSAYQNYNFDSLLFGLLFFILPLTYNLIKDGLGQGQSYGKSAFNLMVVNVNTNKPCSKTNSVGRNLLSGIIFNIPYIGALIEIIMVFANPDGRKLSDLGAGTQVIDKNDYKN